MLLDQFQISPGSFDVYIAGVARDSAAAEVRKTALRYHAGCRLHTAMHCHSRSHARLACARKHTTGGNDASGARYAFHRRRVSNLDRSSEPCRTP